MNEHPIEGLMLTAMDSIKDMIDVNTIVGEPIETSNNMVIIPISKVGLGFAAGGSEFRGETVDEYTKKEKEEQVQYRLPFGGGAGAGVSISPIAFLVVTQNNVKLLPVNHSSSLDRLVDYVPDLIEKVNCYLNKTMQNKKEERKEEIKREEREHRETKEKLNNITETIQNASINQRQNLDQNQDISQILTQTPTTNRIHPRRNRIQYHGQINNQKEEPIVQEDYEYEYDETNNDNNNDNNQ